MDAHLRQVELEQDMINGGINRARKMFENNETSGNASANPYASAIFRRFVLPLGALVKADIDRKLAGRAQCCRPRRRRAGIESHASLAMA